MLKSIKILQHGRGGELGGVRFVGEWYWPCRRCRVYWRGWEVRRRRWSNPRSPSRAAPRYSRGHRPSPSTTHACKNLHANNSGQESKSQYDSLNLLSNDATLEIVKPCLHVTCRPIIALALCQWIIYGMGHHPFCPLFSPSPLTQR